jgi:hypothetical protein
MDPKKLSRPMLTTLRERGHTDQAISLMSAREAFDEYCNWHGIINWGDTLWAEATALMKLEAPTPSRELTNPDLVARQAVAGANQVGRDGEQAKLVIVLDGGNLRSVMAANKGVSVAVVEYAAGADEEDLILIPQDDGTNVSAVGAIHQVEVNPDSVERLYAAVEEAVPAAEDDCTFRARP